MICDWGGGGRWEQGNNTWHGVWVAGWLAGWLVTGGLKTRLGGVAGSWPVYKIVIEILYPYLLSAVDLYFGKL
jgi:hypothetical protein